MIHSTKIATVALAASLAALAGCATRDGEPPSADALTVEMAAHRIRETAEFAEPIRLEIWSHAVGPTVKQLEARGYLKPGGKPPQKVGLTDKGQAAGAYRDFFQSDIPIYYFPVGRREIQTVTAIVETPGAGSRREVRFTYRESPTELGQELIDSGTRLDALRSVREIPGRAFIVRDASDWRVELIDL